MGSFSDDLSKIPQNGGAATKDAGFKQKLQKVPAWNLEDPTSAIQEKLDQEGQCFADDAILHLIVHRSGQVQKRYRIIELLYSRGYRTPGSAS